VTIVSADGQDSAQSATVATDLDPSTNGCQPLRPLSGLSACEGSTGPRVTHSISVPVIGIRPPCN